MPLSKQIKPISFLKANAANIADSLKETREPMIITQNGEARFIVQDIESFEEQQETMALLKLLAMSRQDVAEGKTYPAGEVFENIRKGVDPRRCK